MDNFSTAYRFLVYKLIVTAVICGLCCAVIIPTLNNILSTEQFEQLSRTFSELWADIIALNTELLHEKLQAVLEAFRKFGTLIADKAWLVAIACICLAIIHLINKFLSAIGDYVMGALVNDRMVMHAKSSFTFTLFKNIKKAAVYGAINAPLMFVYDVLCVVIMWAVVFVGLGVLPVIVKIFLLAVIFVLLSAVKFVFTCDWIPTLIKNKDNNRKAIAATLSRKGKKTAGVFSTALVFKLIIICVNVMAIFFTLGAGILLTVPASYLILSCYSFVNYCDRNKLKYFVDDYTVISPQKETPVSREEFFKGED